MRCFVFFLVVILFFFFFFFQAEDGIRDLTVTGVQTCALPILAIEPRFESVTPFSEGLAGFEPGRRESVDLDVGLTVRRPGPRGFMDRLGNIVVPATWLEAYQFRDGRALVCTGGTMRHNPILEREMLQDLKYSFIDRTGRIVIGGNYAAG